MNAKTAGTAMGICFTLISGISLAVVCWFVYSELFSNPEPQSAAIVASAWESPVGTEDPGRTAPEVKKDVALSPAIPAANSVTDGTLEPDHEAATAPPVTGIQVLFKMENPRSRRKAWVLLPTLSRIEPANHIAVEALARGTGPNGETAAVDSTWLPADPDMVSVSKPRNAGNSVTITVLRAGQSTIEIFSLGTSKHLTVSASYEANGMRVEISQQ